VTDAVDGKVAAKPVLTQRGFKHNHSVIHFHLEVYTLLNGGNVIFN
jgi:hypothetical protein